MQARNRILTLVCFALFFAYPKSLKADLWGGDVIVLTQILTQTIKQLIQLKEIFKNSKDTLNLMKDINRGARDGLNVIRIIHPKFNPGLYGKLENAEKVLTAITDLYGKIPKTSESRVQEVEFPRKNGHRIYAAKDSSNWTGVINPIEE